MKQKIQDEIYKILETNPQESAGSLWLAEVITLKVLELMKGEKDGKDHDDY